MGGGIENFTGTASKKDGGRGGRANESRYGFGAAAQIFFTRKCKSAANCGVVNVVSPSRRRNQSHKEDLWTGCSDFFGEPEYLQRRQVSYRENVGIELATFLLLQTAAPLVSFIATASNNLCCTDASS